MIQIAFRHLMVLLLCGVLNKGIAQSDFYPDQKSGYSSQLYTSEIGLPVGNVNQIHQTPDGFLWMATYSGLVRFDGSRYKVYQVSEYPNLTSNRIVTIQGGIGNSFWLTTEQKRLIRYRKGEFKRIGFRSRHQRVILDGDSVEWVLSKQGLSRVESDTLELINPSPTELIMSFERLNDGTILVGTSKQALYSSKYPYTSFTKLTDLPSEDFARNIFQQNGKIWSYNRKIFFHSENTWVEPVNIEIIESNWSNTPPLYFDVREINQDKVLVSAETGLFIISNGLVKELESDTSVTLPTEAERTKGRVCTCANGDIWAYVNSNIYVNGKFAFEAEKKPAFIYCDRESNIWVVFRKNGLQRFRKTNLKNIVSTDGYNNFYGIYQDSQGKSWFGEQHNRLYYFENDSVHHIPSGFKLGATGVFLETSNNWLIIGKRYWDRNKTKHVPSSFDDFNAFEEIHEDVYSIFEDRDSNIWFGTSIGLFKVQSGVVEQIKFPGQYYTVRFFIQDERGLIWMATNGGGLSTYDPSNEKWAVYNRGSGLGSNNIRALLEVDNGNILIASEDAGLFYFNVDSNKITNITIDDGLYQNGIHSLLMDKSKRLWMSTNQGIFSIDYNDLKKRIKNEILRFDSRVYTENNGMLNREANGGYQNSGLIDEDGKVWFPTQEGIAIIDPNAESPLTADFDVNIVEIQVGDSTSTTVGSIVHLNQDQGDVRISYSSPTFISPGRVQYSYMLEGFNESWVNVENRTEAVFTNLPGGEYTFRVKASLDDNEEVLAEASIPLVKGFKFSERPIFYILILLVLILTFYAIYQFRIRQLKWREAELESQVQNRTKELEAEKQITESQKQELIRLDKEKNTFFENVSHEFRTPLTLILGPLEELQKNQDNDRSGLENDHLNRIIRNSKRLQSLVEQMLDLTKLESGTARLTARPGVLNQLLQNVAGDYHDLSHQKNISFTVELVEKELVVEFDPDELDKVFHNLLSNAFKFTPSGKSIELRLTENNAQAIVTVTDTGKGIAEKQIERLFDRFYQIQKSEFQPGTGIGLSIAKEITHLHKGEIGVESKEEVGTCFTVTLPIVSNSHDVSDLVFPKKPVHEMDKPRPKGSKSKVLQKHLKKVLIVEDNQEIQAFIQDALMEKFNIVLASSGNEAWTLLDNDIPDLIVSDIMMADGDGLSFLKKVRSSDELHYLPFILLTSKSEMSDKLSGLDFGADDYLTKPFNMDELELRIDNLIQQRMRLKKFFSERHVSDSEIHLQSISIPSKDEEWISKFNAYIETHLGDEDLTVESLAAHLAISRASLFRKTKNLFNESPAEIIKRLRMERAKICLEQRMGNISEIAYSCGFSSLAHFSKSFKQYYGKSPSHYSIEGSKVVEKS